MNHVKAILKSSLGYQHWRGLDCCTTHLHKACCAQSMTSNSHPIAVPPSKANIIFGIRHRGFWCLSETCLSKLAASFKWQVPRSHNSTQRSLPPAAQGFPLTMGGAPEGCNNPCQGCCKMCGSKTLCILLQLLPSRWMPSLKVQHTHPECQYWPTHHWSVLGTCISSMKVTKSVVGTHMGTSPS